jgi:hypothetical protein
MAESIPSCMRQTGSYVMMTRCEFTVVSQCVDPPQPALIFNTNDEKKALSAYDRLVMNEKHNGGGEFAVTMYKHTDKSEIKYWTLMRRKWRGPSECSPTPVVYAVMYDNSDIVAEYNYMYFTISRSA